MLFNGKGKSVSTGIKGMNRINLEVLLLALNPSLVSPSSL
jgi:hypothetical protein